MKILCATEFYPPSTGGMQISNYLIIEELQKIGYEVRILIFGKNKPKNDNHSKIYYYNLNMSSLIDNFKVGKLIKHNIKKFKPEFTLLMDDAMGRSVGTVPFFKEKNTKLISINSGSYLSRNYKSIRKFVASFCTKRGYDIFDFIFLSDSTYEFMKNKFPEYRNKMTPLGRPVPDYFFDNNNENYIHQKYKKLSIKKPYFFSCSRAVNEKGIKEIILALNTLRNKNKREEVNFIYTGDGPELDNWKRLVKELNLKKIHLIGNIPYQDIKFFYDNCYMTIFPSYYEGETFGRAWVESFACGKPVISTLIQNLKFLVKDKVNAIKIESNPESISLGIEKAINLDKRDYKKLADNAILMAKNYQQSILIKKMINVLQEREIIT